MPSGTPFLRFLLIGGSLGAAFGTRTNLAQMIERIDPSAVPVVPVNAHRVLAHFFDGSHLDTGLVHREEFLLNVIRLLGLSAVRSGASRTRAFIAQIAKRIVAVVAIAPVDFNPSRFRNGNVFGVEFSLYGHS